MRAVLEQHLLRKAAPNFRPADLDRLRGICEETDLIKDYGSRWVLKNWEFHRALYGRSGSPMMIEAVERIQLNIERYARRAGNPERLRQAAAEHRQIVNAIERKDFPKAAGILERHIMHTGEDIRRDREEGGIRPPDRSPKNRKRPAIAR